MNKEKIAVTLDSALVERLDLLVRERLFPNRSRAIQEALEEKIERLSKSRLARECAKLDPEAEKAMAEEALTEDLTTWPKY